MSLQKPLFEFPLKIIMHSVLLQGAHRSPAHFPIQAPLGSSFFSATTTPANNHNHVQLCFSSFHYSDKGGHVVLLGFTKRCRETSGGKPEAVLENGVAAAHTERVCAGCCRIGSAKGAFGLAVGLRRICSPMVPFAETDHGWLELSIYQKWPFFPIFFPHFSSR